MKYNITKLKDLDIFTKNLIKEIEIYKKLNNKKNIFIYLSGDLGTGKTTFSKIFIKNCGYTGNVTSPTYNILQEYNTSIGQIVHCDFYRIGSPEELYDIGIIDLPQNNNIILIEWPEKGIGVIADYTYKLNFELVDNTRFIKLKKKFKNNVSCET